MMTIIKSVKLAGWRAIPASVAILVLCQSLAHANNGLQSLDLIKALIGGGQYSIALRVANGLSKDVMHREQMTAFTKALILKNQGKLAEAAAALRALLSNHPEFVEVRRELAHTLFLMGDSNAAAYHFELLAQSAVTDQARQLYESYVVRSKAIRSWTLGGYLSLAPSTNITNSTSSDIVYIGGIPFRPNQKAESGIGIDYGLNGTYRFDLPSAYSLTIGGGFCGTLYKDSSFNYNRLETFGALSRPVGNWDLSLGISTEFIMFGGQAYRFAAGPFAAADHSFGRFGTVRARASWRYLDYATANAFDGSETKLSLEHIYAISAVSSVRFNVDLTYVSAAKDFNAYLQYGVGGKFIHEWDNGVISDFGLQYDKRNYRGNFPLMGRPRMDQNITASIGATFRKFNYRGFAPRLEYAFSENFSNVGLYNYTKNTFALQLTKNF